MSAVLSPEAEGVWPLQEFQAEWGAAGFSFKNDVLTRGLPQAARIEYDPQNNTTAIAKETRGPVIGGFLWETQAIAKHPPVWSFALPVRAEKPEEGKRPPKPDSGTAGRNRTLSKKDELQRFQPVFGPEWSDRQQDLAEKPLVNFDFNRVPGGFPGICIDSVDTGSQHDLFLPAGGILIAPHGNGEADLGTPVYGLEPERTIDQDNKARLQSLLRTYRYPNGFGDGYETHGLALQYGDAIGGNPGLGVVADLTGSVPAGGAFGGVFVARPPDGQVLASMSARQGGPIDVGGIADIHQLAVNADKEPLNAAHLSTKALYRGPGGSGDDASFGDGPLEFGGKYIPPTKGPYVVSAFLRWDKDEPHDFVKGSRPGKWRFQSEAFFQIIGVPYPPPRCDGGRPQPQPGGQAVPGGGGVLDDFFPGTTGFAGSVDPSTGLTGPLGPGASGETLGPAGPGGLEGPWSPPTVPCFPPLPPFPPGGVPLTPGGDGIAFNPGGVVEGIPLTPGGPGTGTGGGAGGGLGGGGTSGGTLPLDPLGPFVPGGGFTPGNDPFGPTPPPINPTDGAVFSIAPRGGGPLIGPGAFFGPGASSGGFADPNNPVDQAFISGPRPRNTKRSRRQDAQIPRVGSARPRNLKYAATDLEMAFTSILGRPQNYTSGAVDLRNAAGLPEAFRMSAQRRESTKRPVVLRGEFIGKQQGYQFSQTEEALAGRYLSGTGNGGLWWMPPEMGIESKNWGGTVSTSFTGNHKTRHAFGTPDESTGAYTTGFDNGLDTDLGSDLTWNTRDESGTLTEAIAGLDNSGRFGTTGGQFDWLINDSGGNINAAKVVKIKGYDSTEGIHTIDVVSATTDRVAGVLAQASTQDGDRAKVITRGNLSVAGVLNTSGASVGDPVYTDASGDLTLTAGSAIVGWVSVSHATQGRIFVDVGGSSSATGLTGPASSTDNAIVRWDGTGGTALQDSNVTVEDDDSIEGVGAIQFDKKSANPATTAAQSIYVDDGTNYDDGTVVLGTSVTPIVAEGLVNLGGPGDEQGEITVEGASFDTHLSIHRIGGSVAGDLNIHRHSTTSGGIFAFSRSNTDDDTHAILDDGDVIGSIRALGHDGVDYNRSSQILFEVDGTPGINDMPGRIVFETSPDGSNTPEEAMRISNNKAVDIAGLLAVGGAITQDEQSAATGSAGTGVWWTKNDAPTNPYFTDDGGTSHPILLAPGLGSVGDLYVRSTKVNRPNRLGVGSAGQILGVVSGAPAWITAGKVAKTVFSALTSSGTVTAQIPLDNTVPQSTEGTQILSASITPTNSSSTLIVEVELWLASNSTTEAAISALFRDSDANAVAGQICFDQSAFSRNCYVMKYAVSAGSTSATTFKVRVGRSGAAATITYNGSPAGASELGAIAKSSIKITEVLP